MNKKYLESGQAAVLLVLAMVALIGFTALAVDGGRLYMERINAQTAVDSAAIAGALAKCQGDNITIFALNAAQINDYDNNGSSNVVTVNNPPTSGGYVSDNGAVEVVITSTIKGYFSPILNIFVGPLQNTVRAVGWCGMSGVPGGIFDPNVFRAYWAGAKGNECDNINFFDWSGSNYYNVSGGVHSNNYINISGSGSSVSGISTCVGDKIGGGSANFTPPLQENTPSSPLPNPFEDAYVFSRFSPGGDIYDAAVAVNRIVHYGSKIDISWLKDNCWMDGVRCYNDSSKVLQDGIYVSFYNGDGAIEIGDSNIHGDEGSGDYANVTFIASSGGIKLAGSSLKLNPYVGNSAAADIHPLLMGLHGILAATWWDRSSESQDKKCKDWVIYTSGSDNYFGGFFYAPHGQIEFSGSQEHITGCAIAYTIKLNGSNSEIICDDTWFPDNSTLGLVE